MQPCAVYRQQMPHPAPTSVKLIHIRSWLFTPCSSWENTCEQLCLFNIGSSLSNHFLLLNITILKKSSSWIEHEQMLDSNLRMFQINILVPFLEGMESKCACICSKDVMMEFCRMAAKLAFESSVTTRDCNTELKSEHTQKTCNAANKFSENILM